MALKALASSAIALASRSISEGSQADPSATLFGKDVGPLKPTEAFAPAKTPCNASLQTLKDLIPNRGIAAMLLPNKLSFSSKVSLEMRSVDLSSKEYEVFR